MNHSGGSFLILEKGEKVDNFKSFRHNREYLNS